MSDTSAPGAWIWSNLPQIAAAATLGVFVIGIGTWLFGGFTPQSQVVANSVQERLGKLEAGQVSSAQIAASDKAATGTAIEATRQLFYTELKAWPLPREMSAQASAWEAHLSRLDGRSDGFEHRISEAEFGIRDLGNKYNALTTSAPRK